MILPEGANKVWSDREWLHKNVEDFEKGRTPALPADGVRHSPSARSGGRDPTCRGLRRKRVRDTPNPKNTPLMWDCLQEGNDLMRENYNTIK